MSWASDQLEYELGRCGIFPMTLSEYEYYKDKKLLEEAKEISDAEESLNNVLDRTEENNEEKERKKTKIAFVNFDNSSRLYAYRTKLSDLKDGDKLIVYANEKYCIVTFVQYTESKQAEKIATKWIIDKLDTDALDKKKKELEEE